MYLRPDNELEYPEVLGSAGICILGRIMQAANYMRMQDLNRWLLQFWYTLEYITFNTWPLSLADSYKCAVFVQAQLGDATAAIEH